MAYFLNREEPVGRGRGAAEQMQAPPSPLSRLVQDGYDKPSRGAGLPPRAPSGQGFNAGIATQWNDNVQQTTAAHQQMNDPNFVVKVAKPTGYRVSNAPGGSSSLSLAWDEGPASREPVTRRVGARSQSRDAGVGGCLAGGAYQMDSGPSGGRAPYRAPSQDAYGGSSAPGGQVAGGRGSSREPGGMSAC